MRNDKGQFIKGVSSSPSTQFKKGQHWRKPQLFRDKEYLLREYVELGRSCEEIGSDFGVTGASIIFWLKRHGIERRTTGEARAVKQWGVSGIANGMYGKSGSSNPRWRGGITPERQSMYSSVEWSDVSKKVWERDESKCQRCGSESYGSKSMHIHHIVSFSVESMRFELDNLILLCQKCHGWVHSKKNVNKEYIREEVKHEL